VGSTWGYNMGAMLKSLSECTSSAGLETHLTGPRWRSFGNFCRPLRGGDPPSSGDPLRPARDTPSPAGDDQRPAGISRSSAGDDGNVDCHKHLRLDHVYTKGFVAELVVLADSTTDHRPVVTTVKAGDHVAKAEKLVSIKRQNFKAFTRTDLERALNLHNWSKVYDIKDVDAVLEYITTGIVSALNVVAPEKEINLKNGPNLYLARDTLERMKMRDAASGRKYRNFRNKVTRLVRRDKQASNLLSLNKAHNNPKVFWGLADQALGKDRTSLPAIVTSADGLPL
jgi:hypothetical protein